MLNFLLSLFLLLSLSFKVEALEVEQLKIDANKLEGLLRRSEALGAQIQQSIENEKILTGHQTSALNQIFEQYRLRLLPLVQQSMQASWPTPKTTWNPEELHTLALHALITRHGLSLLKTYFQTPVLRRLAKDLLRAHPTHENLMREAYDHARQFLVKERLVVLQQALLSVPFERVDPVWLEIIRPDLLLVQLASRTPMPHTGQNLVDALESTLAHFTEVSSWLVGNSAGSIHLRKGHLYKKAAFLENLKKTMRPFDILLDKTPFILTDFLIPGHFGHAALYLGNEGELKELGLWEHPSLRPYQEQIRAGKTVIEAVRSGVRLNTLEEFMNVDEVALLRPTEFTSPAEHLEIALAQMNKEYDYNFDVRNPRSIICSELIYLSLGHLAWPTERVMGRLTISPDHLGELIFYQNSPLEFIGYWAADERRFYDWSIKRFADVLGFAEDRESGSFYRRIPHCQKVARRGIRVGSRRQRVIEFTECQIRPLFHHYEELSTGLPQML